MPIDVRRCSYFQLGLPVLYCIPWICTIQRICKFGCSLAFKQIPNPLSWKQEKLVVNLWEREINRQTVRLVTSSLGRIGGTELLAVTSHVCLIQASSHFHIALWCVLRWGSVGHVEANQTKTKYLRSFGSCSYFIVLFLQLPPIFPLTPVSTRNPDDEFLSALFRYRKCLTEDRDSLIFGAPVANIGISTCYGQKGHVTGSNQLWANGENLTRHFPISES